MQHKQDKTVATTNPPEPLPSTPASAQAQSLSLWTIANFTAVAGITSTAVISVQSPIKTLLMNVTKNNTFLPNNYSGGTLSFVKALYAGTNTSMKSSAVRTAYVTTAKENKPSEAVLSEGLIKEENMLAEEGIKSGQRVTPGYVVSAALGDAGVTQIFESRSQLKKIPGLLPSNFKWYTPHNLSKLMVNGFTPRYAAGLINFVCMLQFEEQIAKQLPINDPVKKYIVAGTLSGASAAFFAYPFTAYKDYLLTKTTVNLQGQLVNASSLRVLKDLLNDLTNDPKKTMQLFLSNTKKQLPIRMALTGAVFAIISGTEKILGPEPLAKIMPEQYRPSATPQSFFASAKPAPTAEKLAPEASTTNPKP